MAQEVIKARLVDIPGSKFGRYVHAEGYGLICRHAWHAEDGPLFEQLKSAAQRVRTSAGVETGHESWDGTTYMLHPKTETRQVEHCLYYNDPHNSGARALYESAVGCVRVGDVVSFSVAAPGVGRVTYRVTTMDDKGIYGVVVNSTVRELRPSEVQ
jgi:hypothetical protein